MATGIFWPHGSAMLLNKILTGKVGTDKEPFKQLLAILGHFTLAK